MAANPPLVESPQGLVPAPYASEWIGLARSGVDIRIDGHPQGPDRWDRRGTIFITNLRMVFVAEVPDAATGLVAYDLPLSYITQHSFHQPILGCNNLKVRQCSREAVTGVEGERGNSVHRLPARSFSGQQVIAGHPGHTRHA
ncbi:hypothetical protein F751_1395 [Auxenochlorella protothecoides]|uniref:Uncharacterized protein n=1 Tax=Auxenochlorella protothecoides TaxID=3075 RepID=A0A087SEH6_AUXPR|nr:hypothetical protein F751_1395 [Auxenochlorella protothecoides]KFM24130.1 hypothetical protein F751_1395 [Auxenochlorella protothecoides]